MMLALSCFILAWLVSSLCLSTMLKKKWLIQTLDQPNHRSLHVQPVPRTGGIAIMLGILAGVLPLFLLKMNDTAGSTLLGVVVIGIGLSIVARLDDLYHLSPLTRLVVQVLAAATASLLIVGVPITMPQLWVVLVGVMSVVWMTNLYNFMDGADGLAGGMACIGFACYALAAWLGNAHHLAGFCLAIAGAALAFLRFNFYPAKIFMGDVGSIPLGFFAGAIAWQGVQMHVWSVFFAVLAFLPFIYDATVTLIKRLGQGKKVWLAHREHFYQKLVLSGVSHDKVAWFAYLCMIVCGLCGVYVLNFSWIVQASALTAMLVLLAALSVLVQLRYRQVGKPENQYQ